MAITEKPTALQTDNEKATIAFESFLTPLEDTVEEVDINEVEVIEEDESYLKKLNLKKKILKKMMSLMKMTNLMMKNKTRLRME